MNNEILEQEQLENLTLAQLRAFAKEKLNINSVTSYRKPELLSLIKSEIDKMQSKTQTNEEAAQKQQRIFTVKNTKNVNNAQERADTARKEACEQQQEPEKNIPAAGILDIMADGFGFLRAENCYSSEKDVYVSSAFIRRAGLRQGDKIKGLAQLLYQTEKHPSLYQIDSINGKSYEAAKRRPRFTSLVPIYPDSRISLESKTEKTELASRMIDLIAPIGKGQRGLIVSPPKAGKTTLLKQIANGISQNYPDIKIIILLIDERPEEVTDIKRSTNASVVFSTFDEHPEHHTKVAEMVLEHSKRLVESGDDVVILLDSITRLARSYNLTVPSSGRTLSGGLDPAALFQPKGFFGAARNIENGGSLTIIATALVDTGSKMDDVIYEEFKGTGNMEIHLDRKLSEKRIFPAVDITRSGTRRDDLLLTASEQEAMDTMRRSLAEGRTDKVAEYVIDTLSTTRNNEQFVHIINDMLSKKSLTEL